MRQTQQLPQGFLDVFAVAKLPSLHPAVKIERGGKSVKADAHGFLCFGQYRQGYPTIPLQAVFSMLTDNTTEDDRNVVILDVYDHHSDRVLGKRVITRKDFAKADEFCLFTFDFTPPGPQANMEFRIYYMGGVYVLADKIAVIDPAQVTIQDASQLPAIDPIIEPPPPEPDIKPSRPDPDVKPFRIARIGQGDGIISKYKVSKNEIQHGKGQAWFGGEFTIDAQGDIRNREDDMIFVYTIWHSQTGFGKLFSGFEWTPKGTSGIMIRESLAPNAKFIMLTHDRVIYRSVTGGKLTEKVLIGDGQYFKSTLIMRFGHGESQYYEVYGELSAGQSVKETLPVIVGETDLHVGIAFGTYKGRALLGMKFKDTQYLTGA